MTEHAVSQSDGAGCPCAWVTCDAVLHSGLLVSWMAGQIVRRWFAAKVLQTTAVGVDRFRQVAVTIQHCRDRPTQYGETRLPSDSLPLGWGWHWHRCRPRFQLQPVDRVSSTYKSLTSMIRRRTPTPLFQAHVTWRLFVKALARNNR